MHLILTGATGMVGSAVLHAMVRNPSVSQISILSRRPVPQATDTPEASAKCTVHLHPDFSQPPSPSVLSALSDAHGVVWAQGISVTQVSADEYENITYKYPLVFARALNEARLPKTAATTATTRTAGGDDGEAEAKTVNFVHVSGEGATTEPGRFTPLFASTKGRAETALLALGREPTSRLNVYNARPGGVDVKGHHEIERYWAGRMGWFKELAYGPLLAVSRTVYKDMVSPTRELGEALVGLAAGDGRPLPRDQPGVEAEGRTLRNLALRRLAGI